MTAALGKAFAPRRIALVGASEREGSLGRLLWDNLAGTPADVVPVSPRGGTVFGRTAYQDLAEVPGEIDLVVVGVPAASTVDVIAAAAAKRVPAAVVLSAGFAETGTQGRQLQQRLLAAAGDMRLIGPNCFGIQNCGLPLNASISRGIPLGGGGISVLTQSGSYGMALHALGEDEAMRFAKVCSCGNKADVSDAEVVEFFNDDGETRVLCLLLESITDPSGLVAQIRRTQKPVIIAITGRSPDGRRAAMSHTAALAGHDELRDAALTQAGAVLVRSGQRMLDAAKALDWQPKPAGRRVGIITNSGGLGVELADLLHAEGLTVPELGEGLKQKLAELLPAYASGRNPVDITPVWDRFAELYPAVIEILARSGEVDVVVPMLVQRAASAPVVDAIVSMNGKLRSDGVDVPIYACWVAPASEAEQLRTLQRGNVPGLSWPERTAAAIAVACHALPPTPTVQSRRQNKEQVDPETGRAMLGAAGIAVSESILCTDEEEAVEAAEKLGYPVVAKVVHATLVHKTDIGGVRLALHTAQHVRTAAKDLLALANDARLLLQHQHTGLELVVGGLRDPDLGPAVMVGLGGIGIEVFADVCFALAPVSADQVVDVLRTLKCWPLLDGARGKSVDVGKLAEVASRVGDLMVAQPQLQEIDLNPVLATETGLEVVDWRLIT
jgi:acetyltransferase